MWLSLIFTDGHHKLIRWRLVTHGAIDGFSRLVVYLKCSPNNPASTVNEVFLHAVQLYGLPSRVRSDQGRENILVAQHMLEHRGDGRGSIITGSSTHNQRIERLWRDLHRCVISLYYRLFYHLEHLDLLNPLIKRIAYLCLALCVHSPHKQICEGIPEWMEPSSNSHCTSSSFTSPTIYRRSTFNAKVRTGSRRLLSSHRC